MRPIGAIGPIGVIGPIGSIGIIAFIECIGASNRQKLPVHMMYIHIYVYIFV